MNIKILLKKISILIMPIALFSCADSTVELEPIELELVESENLSSPKATLGKVLFYDKQLSLNNSISCASCHKQNLAFADNVAFSTGFENVLTLRNSMPIQNLNSGGPLFWDGREQSLSAMVMQPIKDHIEMGFDDIDELSNKLSGLPYYDDLFRDAFWNSEITPGNIAWALTSFVGSITSNNTKLDQLIRTGEGFSALEYQGLELFMTKYDCNSCHQVTSPSGYLSAGVFANVGLEENYRDVGLMNVTKQEQDNGKFKIPSLRNVTLTAPYMHDGRFETLDEVMEHYSVGLANNKNLDTRLRDKSGNPLNPKITKFEKTALIAFLNTLTDHQMISDPRFSNPFK